MENNLLSIGLPPLLPDSQLTCIVDDVIAAIDNTGGFGVARNIPKFINHWCHV